MSNADGHIIIDTRIDTNSVQAGVDQIKAALKKTVSEISGLDGSLHAATNEVAQAVETVASAEGKASTNINNLKKGLEGAKEEAAKVSKAMIDAEGHEYRMFTSSTGDTFKVSGNIDWEDDEEEVKEVKKEVDRVEKSVEKTTKATKEFDDLVKKLNSDLQTTDPQAWIDQQAENIGVDSKKKVKEKAPKVKAQFDIDPQSYQGRINTLKKSLETLGRKGFTFGDAPYDAVYTKLEKAKGALEDYKKSLTSVEQTTKRVDKANMKAAKSTKSFASGCRMSFKNILKWGFGINSIYILVNKLRSAVSAGVTNMAQYDSTLSTNISNMQSAFTGLSNSIGAALAPALNAIIPIVTRVINALATAVSYIAMFFGYLQGKKTYTRAVQGVSNVSQAVDTNTESMEKGEKQAEKYLSPLDEINTFQSNKDTGGTGKSAAAPVAAAAAPMFEEAEVLALPIFERIKEKLKDLFQPLIDSWHRAWPVIKEGLLNLWEKVKNFGAKVGELLEYLWVNILEPFLEWFLEKALPKILEVLGKVFDLASAIIDFVVTYILPAIQPVIDAAILLFENLFIDFMDIFGGVLDFLTGVFSGNWELAWQGITEILTGFSNAVQHIGDFVTSIFGFIDQYLQQVFAVDWVNLFGVLGYPIQAFMIFVSDIWDAIRGIFDGVITFITGVFSGNWKKAWEGVKQIFKGVWDALVGVIKLPINAIIGLINGLIDGVVAGINLMISAFNKIKINVPSWVPIIGGRKFGFNIGKITAPHIPMLATGAVIPPNAPFLAMLGDQRNGNNIEMPEALLRKIIREESGTRSAAGSYTFVAQLDGEVIFQKVIKAAELEKLRNGKNPFEYV